MEDNSEKKLNIGLFIDAFFPMIDGVVMVVDNYARRLAKVCNVTVFAPAGREKFDDSSLPYKVVRCKAKFPLAFLDYDLPMPNVDKNFSQEVNNSNLDLVHIHSPFTIGKVGVKYAKKHKIPLISTLHSQFEKDFYRATKSKVITRIMLNIIAKTFNKCDELWTMNPGCVKLSHHYGYKGKTALISNATDLKNDFSTDDISNLKKEFCEKFGIQKDEKVFITIGRVNKLKNLDLIVDSCKILTEKGFKYKWLIVGSGADKEYFENRIKKLGLENNVVFVGKVMDSKEKGKLFAISDLHLFPSKYDTDGIVRIEAAAFSIPTLFVQEALASTVITDGFNGYISNDNPENYAQKIEEIFENEEKYFAVCKQCKKDIYITWDTLVPEVYEKYKIMCKNYVLEQKNNKTNKKS
jgi:1,2-diacylglycerol 3-alpha-glucosyltransferase